MKQTKVRLSPAEYEMVQDAEVILTKNRIMEKTVALLAGVQDAIMQEASPVHERYGMVPPKISKGENYEGLPYVVLDYPRLSGSSGLFFIRSMFWWGHTFSSTLQVSGIHREAFLENLSLAFDPLRHSQYHIGIAADPWLHHFREDNYREISSMQMAEYGELLHRQEHIKIARPWPVKAWDDAEAHFLQSWKFLGALIT